MRTLNVYIQKMRLEREERESQAFDLKKEVALTPVTSASTINKRNLGRGRLGSDWKRKAQPFDHFKSSVQVQPNAFIAALISFAIFLRLVI